MKPLVENLKRLSKKDHFLVAAALLLASVLGVLAFGQMRKELVIVDNGQEKIVRTFAKTIGDTLKENGITLETEDRLSLPAQTQLHRLKNTTVDIRRAVPVTLTVDNTEKKILSAAQTVGEMLADHQISLSSLDRLEGATLQDTLVADAAYKVVRVREETVTEKIDLPFNVITKENSHANKGSQKILAEGKQGLQEKVYKVIYEDGKELLKQLVSDLVIASPADRILEVGTVPNHKTARGDVIRYNKVIEMRSTAYTASVADTGKSPEHPLFGITATGVRAKKGIIAVDPRIIPLGTRVYVEVYGSTPDYGYAVAADTGSAIKGNIIDLYFDSPEQSNAWGSQSCKVYILRDD